jgi:hypothetical protein
LPGAFESDRNDTSQTMSGAAAQLQRCLNACRIASPVAKLLTPRRHAAPGTQIVLDLRTDSAPAKQPHACSPHPCTPAVPRVRPAQRAASAAAAGAAPGASSTGAAAAPGAPPAGFATLERLLSDTMGASGAGGPGGPWQDVEGSWVLYPPAAAGAPRALAHFCGGAFVAAAPQVAYAPLLEALAARGALVVATPFATSFDHLRTADEVYFKFSRCLKALGPQAQTLPAYGLGHSLGALVQLLICSRYVVPRAGNVLMSEPAALWEPPLLSLLRRRRRRLAALAGPTTPPRSRHSRPCCCS